MCTQPTALAQNSSGHLPWGHVCFQSRVHRGQGPVFPAPTKEDEPQLSLQRLTGTFRAASEETRLPQAGPTPTRFQVPGGIDICSQTPAAISPPLLPKQQSSPQSRKQAGCGFQTGPSPRCSLCTEKSLPTCALWLKRMDKSNRERADVMRQLVADAFTEHTLSTQVDTRASVPECHSPHLVSAHSLEGQASGLTATAPLNLGGLVTDSASRPRPRCHCGLGGWTTSPPQSPEQPGKRPPGHEAARHIDTACGCPGAQRSQARPWTKPSPAPIPIPEEPGAESAGCRLSPLGVGLVCAQHRERDHGHCPVIITTTSKKYCHYSSQRAAGAPRDGGGLAETRQLTTVQSQSKPGFSRFSPSARDGAVLPKSPPRCFCSPQKL